jgi:serine/threonine-protein kinase
MEALATGQVTRGDQVDFVGRGFKLAEEIEEFGRFFPSASASTTGELSGPGKPDFADEIDTDAMLKALMKVLVTRETGVLFAERHDEDGDGTRKELYFVAGKLHHVASSNASELLGEYLVRRGKLAREELDLALAVLPRYGGRIGDTLISMGLVGSIDIFRAIREQGRDRVADLFLWRGGHVTFYRGHDAPQVEFPLDIELPMLMLAGLEAAKPGDAPLDDYRKSLDRVIGPAPPVDDVVPEINWPEPVTRVRTMVQKPVKLREVLKNAVRASITAGDVLRGLEILIAANVVAWKD